MTTLVMAAILLFGILAYRLLPVSDLPNVDFPTILVTASLPGASPDTMASAVATPLEKQFSTIAGIDSMTSTSSLGLDPDHAPVQPRPQHRRRRPGRAGGHRRRPARQLPPNMPTPPSYQKVNPADQPILFLALTSPTLPLSAVDEYAETLWPSASPWSTAWPRCRSTARRSTPCASSSTPRPWPRAASASTRSQRRGNGNVNLPTGTL